MVSRIIARKRLGARGLSVKVRLRAKAGRSPSTRLAARACGQRLRCAYGALRSAPPGLLGVGANAIRDDLEERGIGPFISPKSNRRSNPIREAYKRRNPVERSANALNNFAASRSEKTARAFLSILCIGQQSFRLNQQHGLVMRAN
jgi:hypothetical protein